MAYEDSPGRVYIPFPSVEAPRFFADLLTPERSSRFSTRYTIEMEQEGCEAIVQPWTVNTHLAKLGNEPQNMQLSWSYLWRCFPHISERVLRRAA